MSNLTKRMEEIIRTYLMSDGCKGNIDHVKLKDMKDLKIICKNTEGKVIGIIVCDRIFRYVYTKNTIDTTDYELELYVDLYNKEESRYVVKYSDSILGNEIPHDMDTKINKWKAEYNVEMITDYVVFNDILNELKEHRKYICGVA